MKRCYMRKGKIYKCIIGACVIMMTMTGLEGCNSIDGKKKVKEALTKKYQEEFEVITYRGPGFLQDSCTVTAYAVEYPELVFCAAMNMKTGNVMTSYVTKRLCDRITEKIMLNLRNLDCKYFVYTETTLPETLSENPNITLSDYVNENPGNRFVIYLYLYKEDLDKEKLETSQIHMLEGLSEMQGYVSLYLCDSEKIEKVQEYVSSHADTYTEFDEMTETDYLGSIDITDGTEITEISILSMVGGKL